MGYLGRRIGLSQDQGDSNPGAAGGAVGGGLLDLFAHGYFERQGDLYNAPGSAAPPSGLTATGGIISDYTSGSDVYRAHVFTSSGTLNVTALGGLGNTVEYLVVGGGGGGGGNSQSGGGGAGGFRTNLTGHPVKAADYTVSAQTYTVTVGGGGVGSSSVRGYLGGKGGDSEFYPTPVSYPSTQRVRSHGGGGGIGYPGSATPKALQNGGSGGGGVNSPTPYAGGTGNTTDPNHPQRQGYDGGACTPAYGSPYAGGGGGGAGRLGAPDNPTTPLGRSTGGYGLQALIAGPPANPQPIGTPGPGSGAAATGYFAGGGAGGNYDGSSATGGYGGGGTPGSAPVNGTSGTTSSGGGGGGASGRGPDPLQRQGGNGGSGIVVVRYKIAQLTATAKASGGAISFYGGKTIHAFTTSGSFENTSGSALTIEFIAIAGGGGGGGSNRGGGGGGAGGIRTNIPGFGNIAQTTIPTVGPGSPNKLTIVNGGGGDGGGFDVGLYSGTSGGNTTISGPGPISVTATGGGGGTGSNFPSIGAGIPGGSGGGGSDGPEGSLGPGGGTAGGGAGRQGYSGGNGFHQSGVYSAGGGGGGSNGAGQNAVNNVSAGGAGGAGLQLPTTYRNPASTLGAPGPSGTYWVAGGGGGGGNASSAIGGSGGASPDRTSPYAGAGRGSDSGANQATSAPENSGSGGGGAAGQSGRGPAGSGGSGIVVIAYPT